MMSGPLLLLRFIFFSYGTELLSSLPQSRSVKKGGNVCIAPGNQLLVTDHGLAGFPDLKVNPGLENFVSFVNEFT